jgi:hypothetical protein
MVFCDRNGDAADGLGSHCRPACFGFPWVYRLGVWHGLPTWRAGRTSFRHIALLTAVGPAFGVVLGASTDLWWMHFFALSTPS